MAFLTIDENKCKQDGICAAECPRQIITQKDELFLHERINVIKFNGNLYYLAKQIPTHQREIL